MARLRSEPVPLDPVAEAREALERPERERQQAELEAVEAEQLEKQRKVAAYGREILARLAPIGRDVRNWFATAPVDGPLMRQQTLDPRSLEAVDRVITTGNDLLERAGDPALTVLLGQIKELDLLVSPARLDAITEAFRLVDVAWPGTEARFAAWRATRVQTVMTLQAKIKIITDTATWISGSTEKETA